MTSILQSSFEMDRKRGVRLELCHRSETYHCRKCTGFHPVIWVIWRKPAGQFGHWTEFRINGEKRIPDLSCPIDVGSVGGLPRDAKMLGFEETSEIWHS